MRARPWNFSSLLLLGLLACKTAGSRSSSPDLSTAPKSKTFTEWGEFLVDVNDVVTIHVQNKPELNGAYRVSPSGNISLPIAGVLRAKGLTEVQLRESLIIKLRPHITAPRVGVSVTQLNSYMVYFSGKVQRPGTYRLEAKTTLLQGLALAGGVASEAVTRVVIVRETPDGSKKRFETSYAKVKEGDAQLDNFFLERGDLVLID